MTLLITIATKQEASPLIEALEAQTTENPSLYLFPAGKIIITGIGPLHAAITTTKYLNDVDEVWNLGLAGILTEQFEVGSIHSIGSVNKWVVTSDNTDKQSLNFACAPYPEIVVGPSPCRLITSSFPVHDEKTRDSLAQVAHLVDMEGYGVALASKQANKPCRLWKVISDIAIDPILDRKGIEQMIDPLSERLAETIIQQLEINHL